METSVLLMQNIRTFHQRSPMFCNFRAVTSLPYKKKVKKISYIFYTITQNILYLLTISGEGFGVE